MNIVALLAPLLKSLLQSFLKSQAKPTVLSAEAPVAAPENPPIEAVKESLAVDWSDPKANISKYFTVHDATWLPSWSKYHSPTDEEKAFIIELAHKMDAIREFLGEPIIVHVWMRPKDYNSWLYHNVVWKALSEEEKAKKKVPNSPHITGRAIDWSVQGKKTVEGCDEIRKKIIPMLPVWGVRCENIIGNWIHIDTIAPGVNPDGKKRWFFIP